MQSKIATLDYWSAWHRHSSLARYAGSVLAIWLALSLWTLFPVLNRHPFALFLAAVVLTARFLGLGPALLGSIAAVTCLDFIILPRSGFGVSPRDELERLLVFLALAVLIGSLARQKTKAEVRAERSMREMAAIVECSDDAIFSTTPDGIITSWNRGAEKLYGFTADEMVGSPIVRLAPPERQQEAERNRDNLSRGHSIAPYETERMSKDGSRIPILLTVSPLRNPQGKIVGASAIARDISAKRHSEEAVRRSEKLATAGRLAASIAHEINNPLEAVLNLIYLARHDPAQAERYLSMAEEEVARAARIAQQTLGFVRDNHSVAAIDPATIMDEVLEIYARKLEGKQIRVTRNYRGQCHINGYSGEVRQLLTNLLVNAVDAMDANGTLQVRVRAGRQSLHGQEGVRITIADNGSGIPCERVRRIFEPFYTTKQDSGTGLGLWVSQGIVQKHGGSIQVRSRVDGAYRGTVFAVFLPSVQAAVQVA